MFKVKHWKTGEELIVYGFQQTNDATTWFLFFQDGMWLWEVADNWIPVG